MCRILHNLLPAKTHAGRKKSTGVDRLEGYGFDKFVVHQWRKKSSSPLPAGSAVQAATTSTKPVSGVRDAQWVDRRRRRHHGQPLDHPEGQYPPRTGRRHGATHGPMRGRCFCRAGVSGSKEGSKEGSKKVRGVHHLEVLLLRARGPSFPVMVGDGASNTSPFPPGPYSSSSFTCRHDSRNDSLIGFKSRAS